MKKLLLIPALVLTLVALTAPRAHAGDEFEDGFKYELGAIAARTAVGLGFGIVRGPVHVEHGYDRCYECRQGRYEHRGRGHGHYRDGHHWRHKRIGHHGHGRGRHNERVVYRPYRVRYERHVVRHYPRPPMYWPGY